jgi:hypothetical protein
MMAAQGGIGLDELFGELVTRAAGRRA